MRSTPKKDKKKTAKKTRRHYRKAGKWSNQGKYQILFKTKWYTLDHKKKKKHVHKISANQSITTITMHTTTLKPQLTCVWRQMENDQYEKNAKNNPDNKKFWYSCDYQIREKEGRKYKKEPFCLRDPTDFNDVEMSNNSDNDNIDDDFDRDPSKVTIQFNLQTILSTSFYMTSLC